MMKRVVVTGMGIVSPVGNSLSDFWRAIRKGESGVGPITRFDTSAFTTRYAAEVKEFDPTVRIDKREARKMDRFAQYSVYAALEAWEDAGLAPAPGGIDATGFDPERLGVILGVGIGGFETIENSTKTLFEKGPSRVPPMTIPKMIANIGPAQVAIAIGALGPVYSLATACASATDAIGNAMRHIREGLVDVAIAGGAEAPITQLGISGFNVIQALSTKWEHDPKRASRPFDKDRDGFVMGEGAGVLILESLDHALARGARIYAEVAGNAMTDDANHLTAPHPEGAGAARAMTLALKDAGMKPEDIDYINAHGTSTPINDPVETLAIKLAFGDHAYKVAISSTKSMTGHCVGAAGAVEGIASVMAIHEGYIPATINLEEPGEGCDLDYVPGTGRAQEVRAAMSNSLGFGGHNGVVVFRTYQ
ncbi:MAG: beta-ketoacyl-[acyl-carrier-protein] synthase II [Spirochaetaceae bacterium]|nr:MAG: beta-ketoacyl-[acyl-carrier-protein] synthase II [Spirochaetaceae bacterium]